MEFYGIIVETKKPPDILVDFEFAPDDMFDLEEKYIKRIHFQCRGVPADEDIDNFCHAQGEDLSKYPVIGNVQGTLILCKEMEEDGYEPYQVCDDIDGSLEFVMSALIISDAAETSLGFYYNVFDIDNINIDEKYNSSEIRSAILERLPNIIFQLANVYPDILTYYPLPINNWQSVTAHQQEIMNYILLQANEEMEKIYSELSSAKNNSKQEANGNILHLNKPYQATEDDLNRLFGRRHSGSSYPEHLKDQKLISYLHKLGFTEIEDTRIFHKLTREL